MARGVEVLASLISVSGLAIGDEGMAVRKCLQKVPDLHRKWVFLSVAGTIAPPYFFLGGGSLRKRKKHGKHRRRADACAQQHNRSVTRSQREASSRRTHLNQVASLNSVVEVPAPFALGTLHTDPVRSGILRTGH